MKKFFINSRKYVIISLVLFISFALWSKYVDRTTVKNLDFAITVKVQDKIAGLESGRIEGLFEDIGILASPSVSVAVVLFMALYMFFYRKKRLASFFILLAFGLLIAAEIYGKLVVHHPAPPYFMLKNPTTIFPTYHVWEEFSYPSGHVARATFMSIIFLHILYDVSSRIRKKYLLLVMLVALYISNVAVSKMYLGQHWFSDTLGGFLLGAAFGFPLVRFLRSKRQ